MLKQISLRIPKTTFDVVSDLSKVEHIERSMLFRQALVKGVKQLRQEAAVDLYKEGNISISGAAELANLGVGEMMDLLIKNGIKSDLTLEDLKEERKTVGKII